MRSHWHRVSPREKKGLPLPRALQRLHGDPKGSLWSCRPPPGHCILCMHIPNASGWVAMEATPSVSSSPTSLMDRRPGSHRVPPSPSMLLPIRSTPWRSSTVPCTPSLPHGTMQALSLCPPRPMSHIPSPSLVANAASSSCPGLSPAWRPWKEPRAAELCWDCAHGIVLMWPPSFYLSSSLHPRPHLWARFGLGSP